LNGKFLNKVGKINVDGEIILYEGFELNLKEFY
jgi:hypothetical protein